MSSNSNIPLTQQEEECVPRGGGAAVFSGSRNRVGRILNRINRNSPHLSVERAKYFTESFRRTEHHPLVMRWALAMANVMEKIEVQILPNELIVGRGGPEGCYGILYPELEGAYFAKAGTLLETQEGIPHHYTPYDLQVIRDELLPYWEGRTFRESLAGLLPDDLKYLLYKDGDIYTSSFIVHESATIRHSLQWELDYKKVIERGFEGIGRDARERLDSLDVNNPRHNWDKAPYYRAVIIICDAMRRFAERHAELARKMAETESDPVRRQELLDIVAVCDHVPFNPARNFREAIQAQWFAQLASRFEQVHGGNIGNGRIDQYLYPLYRKDREEGRISEEDALELLQCLWLNMAQFLRLQPTAAGFEIYEGNAHWEHTTIGGLKRDGTDATNELSYLILRSKREFPLDYPYLGVRVHKGTPEPFLMKICELIKEGTGFPKLLNDEEIIPLLLAKGAEIEEARDYCGSGCSEVRLINRNTYFTGTTWINLAAVVEMTLYDGRCSMAGERRVGLPTGDPRRFKSYEEFWDAFRAQLEYVVNEALKQLYIADSIRARHIAAPLLSALHDLCMEQGKDVNEGRLEGGISRGGQIGPIGFATAIDCLAAIRKLVYEDETVCMDDIITALKANFEGHEVTRQLCFNAPKFGNLDRSVDEIGRQIEELLVGLCQRHTNFYGGQPEIFYVPVTSHVAMGRVTGATPNGRRAGEALSEGICPSLGADNLGPTAALHSVAYTKNTTYTARAARILNVRLTPQSVSGIEGTRKLAAFIRTWCEQKHWYLQVNIVNRATLVAAQNDPEKYRNLLVRVAGHSAYFADLSKPLQDQIII